MYNVWILSKDKQVYNTEEHLPSWYIKKKLDQGAISAIVPNIYHSQDNYKRLRRSRQLLEQYNDSDGISIETRLGVSVKLKWDDNVKMYTLHLNGQNPWEMWRGEFDIIHPILALLLTGG